MFQGIVRSVEMARIMCCRENHNSLLIGARNRVMELTTNNLEKISASLSLCQIEVSRVSSVSKKCFLRKFSYKFGNDMGVYYRFNYKFGNNMGMYYCLITGLGITWEHIPILVTSFGITWECVPI